MARKRIGETEMIIDLHGLTYNEANDYLKEKLNYMPKHILVVRVIHGYHGGKTLSKLVREDFYHYRIDEIVPVFANDGETMIYLKQEN